MRKRLRKKLRLGEFEDLLVPIAFDLASGVAPAEVDAMIDRFISLVESLGLAFGGGGGGGTCRRGFAESAPKRPQPTEAQAESLRRWLSGQPQIHASWVGSPMKSSAIDDQHRLNPHFPTTSGLVTITPRPIRPRNIATVSRGDA